MLRQGLDCSTGGRTRWAAEHLTGQAGGRLTSRGKQRLTVSRMTLMEGSGFKVAVYGGDVRVDRLPVGPLGCDHVIYILENR